MFLRDGAIWPSEPAFVIEPDGRQPGDRIGRALSLDGQTLAIGAPGDDGLFNEFPDSGAVFTYLVEAPLPPTGPCTTTWTGAAVDGIFTNPANWTVGVPDGRGRGVPRWNSRRDDHDPVRRVGRRTALRVRWPEPGHRRITHGERALDPRRSDHRQRFAQWCRRHRDCQLRRGVGHDHRPRHCRQRSAALLPRWRHLGHLDRAHQPRRGRGGRTGPVAGQRCHRRQRRPLGVLHR